MSDPFSNFFPKWEKEIFVYGSNLRGRHEAGAALNALKLHGAEPGHYEGLMGSCYAIPTKDEYMNSLTLEDINQSVDAFIMIAAMNHKMKFNVTAIGCGFAGYTPRQIAPMFRMALIMDNIYLPYSFLKILVANPRDHKLSFDQ